MANNDICAKLQELIQVMSDTELSEYVPTVVAAKELLTPKTACKKSTPIKGQISLEEVLSSYH